MVLVLAMTLASGCAPVSSPNAICDGTVSLRDTHAEALLADGGDVSVQTGAALIAALDAGCDQ
jgi:hypothetical protein